MQEDRSGAESMGESGGQRAKMTDSKEGVDG